MTRRKIDTTGWTQEQFDRRERELGYKREAIASFRKMKRDLARWEYEESLTYYQKNREKRLAYQRAYSEAHDVPTKMKARWHECTTPIALHIIDTISLLKTNEQREQYACWIMFLEGVDRHVRLAVKRNTTIDHFLADHEDSVNEAWGLPAPRQLSPEPSGIAAYNEGLPL